MTPQAAPLAFARGAPRAWLLVAYLLAWDHQGRYLAVVKSACSVYLDAEMQTPILRYEYDRDPAHEHPAAHLQVHGRSEALEELCQRAGIKRELHRFHLPVGGRRFRPSVEDVVEFLVLEGLVEGRSGWREVVDRERTEFRKIQLLAAMRQYPELVREACAELG